uniref:Retrovirus-related Pol polyprotein from transposon TNT 1-94 n=1 Tax=Cajanus cajan TaxID=3821 RepID=A0A151S2D7_CAJCA|nr:Retrovirus-related Pol polyprotein from transposon TNT 1-94 [Cajanus cajan]
MNKTLLERVRCMLSDAKLPKHFWGEALYTAVHVINLTPTVILNSEVPDKIWFGKNASYDHLRVFGCKAFVHIPRDERSKLDTKTRQCIFIGYGEDEFGYRFYDPVEKKLVRSRDVQFMEDQTIEMKDPSWIQRQGNASSLVMVRMNLATGFMILLRRSLLEALMYSSWKTKPLKTLIRWKRLHPRKIGI